MSNYPPYQSPGTSPQGYPQPGYPQPGYPQGGYPPEQPRSGCGGCLGKIFIFLGVIFLLLLITCGGLAYYLQSWLKSSATESPAEVQGIGDEIISMQVPAQFVPVGGGRFKLFGKELGQGAIYADKIHKQDNGYHSTLIIASFSDSFGPQFKDQLLKGLEAGQSQSQTRPDDKENRTEALKDEKTSEITRTIGGQDAKFKITEGVGTRSGKAKIRVQGVFQGKTGSAVLILDADKETLSKDDVEKMIKSME